MKVADCWRSSLVREIRRKSIHLTGLSVPFLLLKAGWYVTVGFVAAALLIALVLEYLRLKGIIRLPEVRESENKQVAGYVFYISGCLLAVLLFSKMIAVLAVLMLCIGDAASGLIGSVIADSNVRDHHNTKRRKPSVVSGGMLAVCITVGFLCNGITQIPTHVYVAGAIGATLADSVPLFVKGRALDDNFTIPLLSGLAMTLAATISM